jgi:hypothetical protein
MASALMRAADLSFMLETLDEDLPTRMALFP